MPKNKWHIIIQARWVHQLLCTYNKSSVEFETVVKSTNDAFSSYFSSFRCDRTKEGIRITLVVDAPPPPLPISALKHKYLRKKNINKIFEQNEGKFARRKRCTQIGPQPSCCRQTYIFIFRQRSVPNFVHFLSIGLATAHIQRLVM